MMDLRMTMTYCIDDIQGFWTSFRCTDHTGAPTNRQQTPVHAMGEEADQTALLGPVDGKFRLKKLSDGSVDKNTAVCRLYSLIYSLVCQNILIKKNASPVKY